MEPESLTLLRRVLAYWAGTTTESAETIAADIRAYVDAAPAAPLTFIATPLSVTDGNAVQNAVALADEPVPADAVTATLVTEHSVEVAEGAEGQSAVVTDVAPAE